MMFYNSIIIILTYTLIILKIKKQLYYLNLFHFQKCIFQKNNCIESSNFFPSQT